MNDVHNENLKALCSQSSRTIIAETQAVQGLKIFVK
jgi:hypothetical protein